VAAQKVRVPVIEQAVVCYGCRVVHANEVIPANLTADIKASAYVDGDFHCVYFGEVLAAYAAPDAREKLRRSLL
jgi:flavin reductase (DIM6/NTAB) family NADH-FMN oxidoreductase RutF